MGMRLIDADRLLNHAIAFFTGCHTSILQFSYVSDIIINAPTVDAVPVVRCRDCEHYNPENYDISCDHPKGIMGPSDDDFCSYGKRRTNNDV